MTSSLTEDYLRWLAPQIRDEQRSQGRTCDGLLNLMFNKEFVWLIPNDDNRKADGLDLRVEFCREQSVPHTEEVEAFLDKEHPDPPCSFLEVLIGLSRRLEFAAGGSAPGWAWQLVTNLELHRLLDPIGSRKAQKACDILEACIWRNHEPSGQGGFFPLGWPEEDQTKVELWYQMAAYINEMHPEH